MSTVYLAVTPHGCEICHMGVKGMKWGVRKGYETKDGQLTDKGGRYINRYLDKRRKMIEKYYEPKIQKNLKKYKSAKDPIKKLKYYHRFHDYGDAFDEESAKNAEELHDPDAIRAEKKERLKSGLKSYAKAVPKAVGAGAGFGAAWGAAFALAGFGNMAVPILATPVSAAIITSVSRSYKVGSFINGYNSVILHKSTSKVKKTGRNTATYSKKDTVKVHDPKTGKTKNKKVEISRQYVLSENGQEYVKDPNTPAMIRYKGKL